MAFDRRVLAGLASTYLVDRGGRLLPRRHDPQEAEAHASGNAHAELEHALLSESHHRIKNSLSGPAQALCIWPAGVGLPPLRLIASRFFGVKSELIEGNSKTN